ncbi:hypothetical protein [Burkholderia cenocepacia]|uniref:hypothetical protein n=1 Tax=Burkholderia cenocepacia TaxID=95486 RepID=UPI002ABDF3D3|nr:hypothetical protein [Burkholderia cenocepacia]
MNDQIAITQEVLHGTPYDEIAKKRGMSAARVGDVAMAILRKLEYSLAAARGTAVESKRFSIAEYRRNAEFWLARLSELDVRAKAERIRTPDVDLTSVRQQLTTVAELLGRPDIAGKVREKVKVPIFLSLLHGRAAQKTADLIGVAPHVVRRVSIEVVGELLGDEAKQLGFRAGDASYLRTHAARFVDALAQRGWHIKNDQWVCDSESP